MADAYWTPARDAELKALAAQGLSVFAIVQRMHGAVGYERVTARADELGLTLSGRAATAAALHWNVERDATLRRLWAQTDPLLSISDIVRELGETPSPSWSTRVSKRAQALGLPKRFVKASPVSDRIASFWTPEVDAQLRALWLQAEPVLTVLEIVALLPAGANERWVRQRVKDLALGGRPRKRTRAGEFVKPEFMKQPAKASPRIVYERVTGCTYIDPFGDGSRCGQGNAQTCAKHRERVLPIPRGNTKMSSLLGSLGSVSRTSSRASA